MPPILPLGGLPGGGTCGRFVSRHRSTAPRQRTDARRADQKFGELGLRRFVGRAPAGTLRPVQPATPPLPPLPPFCNAFARFARLESARKRRASISEASFMRAFRTSNDLLRGERRRSRTARYSRSASFSEADAKMTAPSNKTWKHPSSGTSSVPHSRDRSRAGTACRVCDR
jgi:hypothetical protein